jgi:AraC-like DNA-binding protein
VKSSAAVVPVMHRDEKVRTAIRRGLAKSRTRVMVCRNAEHLSAVLQRELVDAVVLDVRKFGTEAATSLVSSYPRIPLFAMSAFRPDDGPLIGRCIGTGFRGILVQGVDDSAAGELIAARSASRTRLDDLGNAPRLLRLTEPLQLQAWHEVIVRVGVPTRTSDIAQHLAVTREHLSREFAAGGAPNLKRVIDLIRTVWVADLLRNPGYDVATVSRILRFSSPSHLAGSVKRVSGVKPSELPGLGPRGVLRRFVRGRMRSRL